MEGAEWIFFLVGGVFRPELAELEHAGADEHAPARAGRGRARRRARRAPLRRRRP